MRPRQGRIFCFPNYAPQSQPIKFCMGFRDQDSLDKASADEIPRPDS
jgi:hypothetical protein